MNVCKYKYKYIYMEVFWNRGTFKSSIFMALSIINHPFGVTPFLWKSSYVNADYLIKHISVRLFLFLRHDTLDVPHRWSWELVWYGFAWPRLRCWESFFWQLTFWDPAMPTSGVKDHRCVSPRKVSPRLAWWDCQQIPNLMFAVKVSRKFSVYQCIE